MRRPIDVLLATDVLAEGVNLQDAALLINFDVHWNPVRMIQRSGRIDRRLNPRIENERSYPELTALGERLGKTPPTYYWHEHANEAPVTVNMILPDELEQALLLRERIATKTLAIDFTLGLEQGTGAEADWMASYKYQGITSLNSLQRDRAIERVANYHAGLRQSLQSKAIDLGWCDDWHGWIREAACGPDAPILAWARFQLRAGEDRSFNRFLTPVVQDGVVHWLWTATRPVDSLVNFWLALDGKTFPPATRKNLPFQAEASRPLSADDLLAAAIRLVDDQAEVVELPEQQVGWPLVQGATAIAAGFLKEEADRLAVPQTMKGYRLIQLALSTRQPRTGPGAPR
jgi:hypothetical protein